MRPRERRDSGQNDLFRARLDQIVDMDHPLAKLGRAVDWRFLEERFGMVYTDKAGHPPLPTRLMAGLSILKHMHNLSDEDLCARWVENPYYQLFCDGMDGPGASATLARNKPTSKGIRHVHHRNHRVGYRKECVSGSRRRRRWSSCAQKADQARSGSYIFRQPSTVCGRPRSVFHRSFLGAGDLQARA
jgi:hypothetical protein